MSDNKDPAYCIGTGGWPGLELEPFGDASDRSSAPQLLHFIWQVLTSVILDGH